MEAHSREDICPELTRRILGSAIEVHRELGPGLLESTYRVCLVHQLILDGHEVRQEIPIPTTYKGSVVDASFRADLIVDESVLLELKAVEKLLPLHEAQTLTYMKLCNLRIGLLINFNVRSLKDGIRRFVR
ncbi:MAG: GxxExxY protein [Usitatibacter sp.]